jgi:hypothetical protein
MKTFIVLASLISVSAFAGPVATPVDTAVAHLKKTAIRTTRHVVTASEEDTVCTAAGDTIVKLQVKESVRQESEGQVVIGHQWKTVKTVVISPDGTVMEECLE